MSKHTSKYYQLVKILRTQKQKSKFQQQLRQQRLKLKLDKANTVINQSVISNIIDEDNNEEGYEADVKRAGVEGKLRLGEEEKRRLWVGFLNKSKVFNQADGILPMQVKINQSKDEVLLQRILQEQDSKRRQIYTKIYSIAEVVTQKWQQILQLKKYLDNYQLQLDKCDRDLLKIKQDFDKQDKKLNERSNRFKEQKSKDMMIKNINKQDQQMRNAMMSRIKLNQELDFSFQLQRRKTFNAAKAAVNEKKKVAQEGFNKIKDKYDKLKNQEQQLQEQKQKLQQNLEILSKQNIYFLKLIIKHFPTHSKGIKWIVDRLSDMKVQLTKQQFPEIMSNQDKQFLQTLFKQSIYQPGKEPSLSIVKNYDGSSNVFTPNSSRIRKYSPMRTEPNLIVQNQFQPFMERKLLSPHKKAIKASVFFDIENEEFPQNRQRAVSQIKKFGLESSSLKKIYEHTGQAIADRIKKKKWHYQSCKEMNFSGYNQNPLRECEDRKINEKLRSTFMNVRQTPRRNQLKKFIFGDTEHK